MLYSNTTEEENGRKRTHSFYPSYAAALLPLSFPIGLTERAKLGEGRKKGRERKGEEKEEDGPNPLSLLEPTLLPSFRGVPFKMQKRGKRGGRRGKKKHILTGERV